MHEQKVSVVIPAYNRGYIIGEALASVLSQQYQNVEVFVVDDGSSDNTREVVEGFRNDKIHYIRHGQNRGASAAYNTGIAAATGAFVAILDSDDVWKPDYLTRQIDSFSRHPEAGVVFSDIEIHSDTTRIPSTVALMKAFPRLLETRAKAEEYLFSAREMYLCLLEEVPVKPSAAVVRREVYERAGAFDEARASDGTPLVPFTDWELFLRFSRSANFAYIDLPLAIQRRTGDASHQQFREKDKLFLLNLSLKEKAALRNDPEALRAVNRGISSHCSILAYDYLHSGQRKKSLALYLQAYKETGELMMLMRATSTLTPIAVRNVLKTFARRTTRSTA